MPLSPSASPTPLLVSSTSGPSVSVGACRRRPTTDRVSVGGVGTTFLTTAHVLKPLHVSDSHPRVLGRDHTRPSGATESGLGLVPVVRRLPIFFFFFSKTTCLPTPNSSPHPPLFTSEGTERGSRPTPHPGRDPPPPPLLRVSDPQSDALSFGRGTTRRATGWTQEGWSRRRGEQSPSREEETEGSDVRVQDKWETLERTGSY